MGRPAFFKLSLEVNAMSEEKVELSTRGKNQIKEIAYHEIKAIVDSMISPMIEQRINLTIKQKLNDLGHKTFEMLIERVIRDVYWKIIEDMLLKANFQDKLKDEIIKYLHTEWACGQVPFDEQFNKALKRALKELI